MGNDIRNNPNNLRDLYYLSRARTEDSVRKVAIAWDAWSKAISLSKLADNCSDSRIQIEAQANVADVEEDLLLKIAGVRNAKEMEKFARMRFLGESKE